MTGKEFYSSDEFDHEFCDKHKSIATGEIADIEANASEGGIVYGSRGPKYVPISIRMPPSVIKILQKQARSMAYNEDKEISYIDLIRESVEKYVKNLYNDYTIDMDPIEVTGKEIIDGMDQNQKLLNKDNECLDTDSLLKFFGIDLENTTAIKIANQMTDIIKSRSLARKLLGFDDLANKAFPRYDRDVSCASHVVSRRGAVPDQIIEGEEVIGAMFDIACNPSIRMEEILSDRVQLCKRANIAGAHAIVKEEESNIINCLKSAAKSSGGIVKFDSEITIAHIDQAYNKVARHGTPANLTCNSITFLKLQSLYATRQGDWEFKISFVTEGSNMISGGKYKTAKINISDRMCDGEVIISGTPEDVGYFGVKHNIICLPQSNFNSLRVGYVAWERISICVIRDYLVSVIGQNESIDKKSNTVTSKHITAPKNNKRLKKS